MEGEEAGEGEGESAWEWCHPVEKEGEEEAVAGYLSCSKHSLHAHV